MDPRIQYARTSDGLSIAFWTKGHGVPFVDMPPFPANHVQLEWQLPEMRAWYERLAKRYQVVRYDARGTGLSGRTISGLSLDGLVADLTAVLDTLSLKRVVLFATVNSGPVAISYATQHPDRVAQIILWCSYANANDFFATTEVDTLQPLVERDFVLFSELLAHMRFGWAVGDPAHRFAFLIREAVSPEVQRLVIQTMREVDVSGLLPGLQTPLLVLHRRGFGMIDLATARRITAATPGASLQVLEGASVAPYLEDTEAVHLAIEACLSEVDDEVGPTNRVGAFRTVLFTDLVGHTEMMRRLGDMKGREVLREHEHIVREGLRKHSGAEVKALGDGFMASFVSVSAAVDCAIELQRAFARRNDSATEPLFIRAGIDAGEPMEEDGDLFGSTVILAARVAAEADAGEILIPEPVRHLLAGKNYLFSDRGQKVLKGFEDAVRLYEVRWQD